MRGMRMREKILVLGAVALFAAGCPRPPDEPKPQVIELEPMFFTILKKGDTVEVKDYGLGEMFDRAEALAKEGRFAEARQLYLTVAKDVGRKRAAGFAWMNVALCDVGLDSPGSALESVGKARALLKEPEELTQLNLVELQAFTMMGKWDEVKKGGFALLGTELPGDWGARVHLYMAQAYMVEEVFDEAEGHARAALDGLFSSVPLAEQYGNPMVCEAYTRLGMVHAGLARRIKFRMPVERMTLDMSDKLALMRQAEEHFLPAIRMHNDEWSPRAGFEEGELYRTFALDLLGAEVPADLEPLEVEVYASELSAKVLPLLRKSREIHRKNVTMCGTHGYGARWRVRSEERISELDSTVKAIEETQKKK